MKKLILVSLAIFVLPVVALAFFQPATLTNGVQRVAVFTQAQANDLFSQGFTLEQKDTALGAAGPISNTNYQCVGGVCKYYLSTTMQKATSTLCAFRPPAFTATSTIESLDYQITVGTSTAATIVANISTNRYASSTATNVVAAQTVAAGVQDTMSDTFGASVSQADVSPSNYILVQTESAAVKAAGGYTYTGACQLVLRVMPH